MVGAITNTSAMIALKNMKKVQNQRDTVSQRVSTGVRFNAITDSSNFAISQSIKSELKSKISVNQVQTLPAKS